MRRAALVLALAACASNDASSTLLVDGLVIGISEGEQRTFRLARTGVTLRDPPAALGATIAGDELALNVGCDAVLGTSGPTRELALELDADGDVTVVTVEVRPSGQPPCLPTLVACLHKLAPSTQFPGTAQCDDGTGKPAMRGNAGALDGTTIDTCTPDELIDSTRIEFNYFAQGSPFSDPTLVDEALLFRLANPDATDTGLNYMLTTEAPLKGLIGSHDVCVSLPNSNVVGTFPLDYVIVRGMSASDPFVGAGTWELGWNKMMMGPQAVFEPYGLEVVSCDTSDTMFKCSQVRHAAVSQWCIPARSGDATSIGMRVWASAAPNQPKYGIHISAAWSGTATPILLVADGQRGDAIDVEATAFSIPIDVQMDVGTGTGDLTVTLQGNATVAPYNAAQSFQLHVGGMCPL